MSQRPLAMVFVGTHNFREVTRQVMNDTITSAMPRLRQLAESYGNQVVYEMVEYDNAVYTYEVTTGYSYLDLQRHAKLVLVPAGDQWIGGRLFQALELGQYLPPTPLIVAKLALICAAVLIPAFALL